MSKNSKKSNNKNFYIITIISLIAIAIICVNIFKTLGLRVDLTEDKRFSLSQGTKNILKNIDTPITIRYYVTPGNGGLPIFLQNYAKRINDLILEYKRHNQEYITIEKYNPLPDTKEEDAAKVDGVQPLNYRTSDPFYMGLAISSLDKKVSLSSLAQKREEMLEYEISRAIIEVTKTKKTKIAIMTEMPLAGMPFKANATPAWFFYQQLERDYDISLLSTKVDTIPNDNNVLIVLHPYGITKNAEYAVDQYLLKGGKVIVALDPNFYSKKRLSPPQQNPNMPSAGGPEISSDLPSLLNSWGIKFNKEEVLADVVNVRPVANNMKIPTLLTLSESSFNQDDIITKELDNVLLIQAGSFDIDKKKNLNYSTLLKSSKKSQKVSRFLSEISESSIKTLNNNFIPSGVEMPISVKISGKFSSAFPSGKPKGADKLTEKKNKKDTHIKSSKEDSVVILISDVDFLYNDFAVQEQNILGQRYIYIDNSNLSFMQNAIEQLAGGSDLIKVRSRSSSSRPFTVINKMEEVAARKYNQKIQNLENESKKVQAQIDELQQQKDQSQKLIISPKQKSALIKFREKEKKVNEDLRFLRRNLHKDIIALKSRIKAINILLIPFLIAIFGMFYALLRRSKTSL